MWRPVHILLLVLVSFCLIDLGFYSWFQLQESREVAQLPKINLVVSALGLTDLCIATEARYTRHPAVTDLVVPFMDYPSAIEHFPTGSFWAPIRNTD